MTSTTTEVITEEIKAIKQEKSPCEGNFVSSPNFPFEDDQIDSLTNAELADAYKNAPILSNSTDVNYVRRLSKGFLVKKTVNLMQEARNMKFLSENLPSIRIPQLVRAFVHGPKKFEYIVMEYVEGDLLSHCWERLDEDKKDSACEQVAQVIATLRTVPLTRPGPIGGGLMAHRVRGLFGMYGVQAMDTIAELEAYYEKYAAFAKRFKWIPADFSSFVGKLGTEVYMAHMDWALRNVILQADGSICTIDWGAAGAYPAHFEEYGSLMKCLIEDKDFCNRIRAKLPVDPELDEKIKQLRGPSFALVSCSL